jgi:hypothetical protein
MIVKFDLDSFEATARVLKIVNAAYCPSSVGDMVQEMISISTKEISNKAGYVGTNGWYVVTFKPSWCAEGEYHAKAMLMSFVVEEYLTKLQRLANGA